MRQSSLRAVALGFALPSLIACSSTSKTVTQDVRPSTEAATAKTSLPATEASSDAEAGIARILAHFARVRFAFDSSQLDPESREALKANADILLRLPTVTVEIQGHADDRGTSEYNLALGERRASAVASYLVTSGVPQDRIRVISYGEERPLEEGGDPTAWSQNRRAEFRVVDGRDVAEGTSD